PENVDLEYYVTEIGAETADEDDQIDTPEAYINEPEYNIEDANGNPTNVQIIYVRVNSGVNGNFCHVVVPFEIIVVPEPKLNPLGDPFGYTLCE
ncbi:hypothetical protein, partial [Haloflavibacter putidus]|uniref:hypothetical protein n=1 Tax=Haloflavibacter putidus TaxID=2576776 RepID=UPI001F162E12